MLLDYSKDSISMRYEMTFIPLYWLRTELIGPSWPRRINSMDRNEDDSTTVLSPMKKRLQGYRNILWAVSDEKVFLSSTAQ